MLSEDRDGQTNRGIWILIGNDVEYSSASGPHWEFYRVGDDFVFYGNGG